MSDNNNEKRVQEEVSKILKESYEHPDVVEFTEILLDQFPDIKNDRQLNLALYIKKLDDKKFDKYLNTLLPEDNAFGKKLKKKKRKTKRKPKRRKTKRGRKQTKNLA